VYALPTITLLSGGGSTYQMVNSGTAITQIKYTTANASSATVSNLPAGISSSWSSNTFTISGSSTVTGAKTYTVTTANSNGCTNATASGTITVNAATYTTTGGPNTANSTKTWTIGGLTWSDRVVVSACNKTSFTNSSTDPQCRSYTVSGELLYYYNWPYVNTNKSTMCPSPWRVPTKEDFDALVSATNYTTLINAWAYGGCASGSTMSNTDTIAYYWSSTENSSNANHAYHLDYNSGVLIVNDNSRSNGFQVRCVK
jgi:hypothetical protein